MAKKNTSSAAAVQGAAAAASTVDETTVNTSVVVKVIGVETYRSKMGKPMIDLILKDEITLFKKGNEVTTNRLAFQAATLKSQLISAASDGNILGKALLKKKMFEFTKDELDVMLVGNKMTIDLVLHTEGETIAAPEGSDGEDYIVEHTFTEYTVNSIEGESPLTSAIALGIDIAQESKNHPGFTIAQAYMAARDGITLSSAALAFM